MRAIQSIQLRPVLYERNHISPKKRFSYVSVKSRIIRSQNAKNVFSGLISNPIFLSFDLQIEFQGQSSKKKP